MSTYQINASRTVQYYDGVQYNMVEVKVTNVDGKFRYHSMPFRMEATDGTTTIHSFKEDLSLSEKELKGFFTTDGFSAFPGNVTITFGYLGSLVGSVENVDINGIMTPLTTFLASLNAPDADNAWLATI